MFVCQHLLTEGDADRARRECCLMGTSTSEANLVSSLLRYIRDDWYITLAGLQGSTLQAMIKSKKHGGARPSRCRGAVTEPGKTEVVMEIFADPTGSDVCWGRKMRKRMWEKWGEVGGQFSWGPYTDFSETVPESGIRLRKIGHIVALWERKGASLPAGILKQHLWCLYHKEKM